MLRILIHLSLIRRRKCSRFETKTMINPGFLEKITQKLCDGRNMNRALMAALARLADTSDGEIGNNIKRQDLPSKRIQFMCSVIWFFKHPCIIQYKIKTAMLCVTYRKHLLPPLFFCIHLRSKLLLAEAWTPVCGGDYVLIPRIFELG
ncbi:hypothetical protein YC2023_038555 [Brassica napus]